VDYGRYGNDQYYNVYYKRKDDKKYKDCTGPTGDIGISGYATNTGATGPLGLMGPIGISGDATNTGATGPLGSVGPLGATGHVGPLGATGPLGPLGATGPVGPLGATGPVGPLGATGHVGPLGATGPLGPLGATGPLGLIGATGPLGLMGATGSSGDSYQSGNYLRVNLVYGNDASATLYPYQIPFKTITSALLSVLPGQTVFIYPGIYNESITIPENTSIRGASVQTVTIQQINPVASIAVVTMNQNTIIEDVTILLSLNAALYFASYVVVEYATGASVNSQVRSCVISATLLSGRTHVYGIRSSGISSLVYTPTTSLLNTQVQINATGNLSVRAIYINGANRFTCRDVVIFANGTGSDVVGCETDNPSAILDINSSSVNGIIADLYQTQGTIQLETTKLINHTAPTSFTANVLPMLFGLTGVSVSNTIYYLLPSIIPVANLSIIPYTFSLNAVIFAISITFIGVINILNTLTFTVYKNNVATPLTLILNSTSGPTVSLLNVGLSVISTDLIDIRFVSVGILGAGIFTGKLFIYS